jgi:hypothetical protein
MRDAAWAAASPKLITHAVSLGQQGTDQAGIGAGWVRTLSMIP